MIINPPPSPATTALLTARGLVAETISVGEITGNNVLASQQVQLGLIGLIAGTVIAKLWTSLAVSGVGLAPTLIKLGIVDTSGNVLATTANVAGDAQWTGAIGPVGFPLTANWSAPASGGYYLAILENGAFGTTPMQIGRLAGTISGTGAGKMFGTGARAFASVAGQTDLVGPLTLADAVAQPCFYLAAGSS